MAARMPGELLGLKRRKFRVGNALDGPSPARNNDDVSDLSYKGIESQLRDCILLPNTLEVGGISASGLKEVFKRIG